MNQSIVSVDDLGMDIINPVRTNCLNMEPEALKRDFGRDIVFGGGGMDPGEILNKGTAEGARAEAGRRLDIFSPGGGFAFSNIQNIMPDVPPENILAMFDEVKKYLG